MKYLKRFGIVLLAIPTAILIVIILVISASIYPFEFAIRYIATGDIDNDDATFERFINYLSS